MANTIDLIGQRFGLWTVIDDTGLETPRRHRGKTLWRCRCDCGTEREVNGAELRNGKSTNCGCVRRAKMAVRNYIHGKTDRREYVVWCGMIARCENPRHKGYARYGGRGIKVCPRWRKSFIAFLTDMGESPTPEHTLNRMDNDGDYEPGNCRWATNKENCQHTRRSRYLEHNGEELTLQEWAEKTGLSRHTIARRIDSYGWSVSDALSTPVLSHSDAAKRQGR